jgi:hypothetical protein
MAVTEKIIMCLCLFSGFFWLRQRARLADLDAQMGPAVVGVFVLLPAILIGEDYVFHRWHFGAYTDLLLKVLVAAAAFPAIGYAFIKTEGAPEGPAEEEQEPGEGPGPRPGP